MLYRDYVLQSIAEIILVFFMLSVMKPAGSLCSALKVIQD